MLESLLESSRKINHFDALTIIFIQLYSLMEGYFT